MERREFFSKKSKIAGWLFACIAFVAGGVFDIRANDALDGAPGYVCVVLFGLGGLVLLKELLRSGPRVVLSEEGLFDHSLGTPVIPWQSIVDVETTQLTKSGMIRLKVSDEAERAASLSVSKRALNSWNKMLGGSTLFTTNLSALDAPAGEVFAAIATYKRYYSPTRQGTAGQLTPRA